MNTKELLKNKLCDYLEQQHGIKQPTQHHFNCLNPEHEDKHPSMIVNKNEPTYCKCFSCGANYDIFQLIGIDYKIDDYKQQYKKACELFNIEYKGNDFIEGKETHQEHNETRTATKKDYSNYIKEHAQQIDQALPYLTKRGISKATAERFKVGYDKCFTEHIQDQKKAEQIKEYYQTAQTIGNNEAVIIPNDKNSLNARFINNGEIRHAKAGNGIFNLKALDSNETVFITEGCFDALSFIELGYNAIALNSTNNIDIFIKYLEQRKEPLYNPLIIALDNDQTGKKASIELQNKLNDLGINNYFNGDLYGQYKDGNESLINDRESFKNKIDKYLLDLNRGLLTEYQNTKSTLAYIDDFKELIERSDTPYIKTGFNKLDQELDGGLYEGLYVVGAVSSLGKTTYCLQIADQIAKQKQDVIIFSLEMSRNELIAKSISRNTAIYCLEQDKKIMQYASTTRTITTKEKRQQCNVTQQSYINYAIADYTTTARHVYIYEATGFIDVNDIRETIREHINITKNKPVVFIDYLQIIQPLKETRHTMTDKQQIDFNITELKRISREFKTPIIAISSFNRMSYNTPVDLQSFKESGAIEYASDVLIGLQFKDQTENTDLNEEKKKLKRTVEAVILKNRNGQTGGKLQYNYYTPFNLFTETE